MIVELTENPYRRVELRSAWEAGRQAGLLQSKLLEDGYATYLAFRRGFKSIERDIERAKYQAWVEQQMDD